MGAVLFSEDAECLEIIESILVHITILSGIAGLGLGLLGILFHYCSKNKKLEDDFFTYSGICYIPFILCGLFGSENIPLAIASVLDVVLLRGLPTNADYAKIFFLLSVTMGILCVVILRMLGARAVLKSAIAAAALFAFGLAVSLNNQETGVFVGVFAPFLFYLVIVWNIWGIRRAGTKKRSQWKQKNQ